MEVREVLVVAEPTDVAEVAQEPVAEPAESTDTPLEDTVAVETPTDTAEPEAEGEDPAPVAEPEEPVPFTLDTFNALPRSERLAWLRENDPEVSNDLEYAGRQSGQAELKREIGSREQTAERLKAIRERLTSEQEVSDEEINFLDSANYASASHRNLSEMAEAWGKSFNPSADEQERINQAALSGDIVTYAQVVLDTAAKSLGSTSVYEQGVKDIPADSALAKSVADDRIAFAAAEVKAALLKERGTSEPAPETPAGPPVDTSGVDPLLTKLEINGPKSLTDDEKVRARSLLGLRPVR